LGANGFDWLVVVIAACAGMEKVGQLKKPFQFISAKTYALAA